MTMTQEEFDKLWDSKSNFLMVDVEKYSDCNGDGCPVNYGNETTEMSQNYGCLPSPYHIARMKAVENKTWACHANPEKPCIGGLHLCKALGISTKVEQLETIF